LKKVKKNWSQDENVQPVTITKTEVAKVRGKPKINGTANLKAPVVLLGCCLSYKLTAIFESRHVGQCS